VNPRTDAEAAEAADRLGALGAHVRVERAEGPGREQFGIGASPAGRRVIAAQALFDDVARRTVDWASRVWPEREAPTRSRAGGSAVHLDPARAGTPIEVPVYVPSRGESLGAVVTVPEDPAAETAVVLLASRARDRAHRNGLWVRTARTLAGDGMYALRLDNPGVGNSTGSPRLPGMGDLPWWAVEDACRFLLDHVPARRILLAGTCYGGRVVLEAASRIPQVEGVAVVVAPVLETPSSTSRLRLRAGSLLGRGEPGRSPDRPIDRGFATALEGFLARGRAYFLYGDRDRLWPELRSALDRLRPPADRYEVELVPGEIHSFRSMSMQALTHDRLTAWCRRMTERDGKLP